MTQLSKSMKKTVEGFGLIEKRTGELLLAVATKEQMDNILSLSSPVGLVCDKVTITYESTPSTEPDPHTKSLKGRRLHPFECWFQSKTGYTLGGRKILSEHILSYGKKKSIITVVDEPFWKKLWK